MSNGNSKRGQRSKAGTRAAIVWALIGVASACAPRGSAPEFEAVDTQHGVVGQELVVNLRATDADGDEIAFDFDTVNEDVSKHATLTRRPDGTAVFRWSPRASSVGTTFVDFHAMDDDGRDTITVLIEVAGTSGEGSAPVFREPLGPGTTLDLATAACLDVRIVVEDTDDSEVALSTAAPLEGAEIVQDSGLEGTWHWCPTAAQRDEERYPIAFLADDGKQDAPTRKNFLVVLLSGPQSDCPGDPPRITHEPRDVRTVRDLEIVADISDTEGLAGAPLLYFTTEEPKLPVDFANLDVVAMELASGDTQDGRWRGRIPNPVAAGAEGDVYYIISATDDDDVEGDCDHVVNAPADGAFRVTVANGGGAPCDPCGADVQCGEAADLCTGLAGDTVCLSACDAEGMCAEGNTCTEVNSVDGTTLPQCVPDAGRCEAGPDCTDDAQEDNDARATAAALDEGDHALTSCTDDEDWFELDVGEGALTVQIEGTAATDLQLEVYDDEGDVVAVAKTAASNEVIHECVPAGKYYARVYSSEAGQNDYTLTFNHVSAECDGATCTDDDHENDDSMAEATYAEVYPDGYDVADRMLCSGDDDFYQIELYTDEVVAIDLAFTQRNGAGDLDLHFYDAAGVDLTPCSEAMPGTCTEAQGQSATSDEHYEHTVDTAGCAPCEFWVAVHGWNGAENSYGLSMALLP